MKVTIQEPGQEPDIVSLDEAIDEYQLDSDDVEVLKQGGVVWYRDTALTVEEDDGDAL